MTNNNKLKILDILLLILTVIIIALAVIISLLHQDNNKVILSLIGFLALAVVGISTYRYWVAYPEFSGLKAPLFVPKAVGLGWSINPRNPIGLGLTIVLTVILIIVFIQAIL